MGTSGGMVRRKVLLSALLTGLAGGALAQGVQPAEGGSVRSRGVIILRPEAQPAPVPAPAGDPNASSRPVPKPPIVPVIKACARPFPAPEVRLDDPAVFRAALAAALRRGGRVVVDLARPYAAGKLPPDALTPWFDEIRHSGGAVTVASYCQQSRGAFGDFFARIFGGGKDPGRPYRAVRRYDAVLQVDALDQVVTQVEFRPRAGASGG